MNAVFKDKVQWGIFIPASFQTSPSIKSILTQHFDNAKSVIIFWYIKQKLSLLRLGVIKNKYNKFV